MTARLRQMHMTSMRGPRVATLLLLPLLLLPVGCGLGSSSDEAGAKSTVASQDTASSDSGLRAVPDATGEIENGGVSEDRQSSTSAMSRAVISTGEISLHGKSVGKLRTDLLRLVTRWNGTVADEQTDTDRRGVPRDASLTLRIPSPTFAVAMQAIAELGTLEHRSAKSEDVTTQVIDNEARVRAAERSIRQIEILLARAEKISDIILIESNLAQRQAELDSLKSQQAYLNNQTSLSTIHVSLTRAGSAAGERDDRGFIAGLKDGWSALQSATVGLATGLGAALPFGAALALIGVPLWILVRRRRHTAPPAPVLPSEA